MSNMNLRERNYNNNFIFRTLLSIYRGKKSFFRHWKIVSAPTSQLWPGIFQSSKMSNNQLSRFVSLLLTCWLISRCDTEWISQVYDFFTSDVIGQNFLLITSSQVGNKFAQKEQKMFLQYHENNFSCSTMLLVMLPATSSGRYPYCSKVLVIKMLGSEVDVSLNKIFILTLLLSSCILLHF